MALTPEDWLLVRFFREVSDQWDNASPMGVKEGQAPLLFLRLESMRAALEIGCVPRARWSWYVDGARLLHRLVRGLEEIDWQEECGRSEMALVTWEDVSDQG